jgi:class 3 adenylate cyclase
MTTRRLAAILAADVVGFSVLMGKDEEGTLARIKDLRRTIVEPKVNEHRGRVFKTTGDGFLIAFSSPVEAVRCAVGINEVLASNGAQEGAETLSLRIGINLGDVIFEADGDVYGDGVNIAARLEQLADEGVTTQLVEAAGGSQLWANRFEGSRDDVFELQDQITEGVVGALEPTLRKAEIARVKRKRPDDLDAYDL